MTYVWAAIPQKSCHTIEVNHDVTLV